MKVKLLKLIRKQIISVERRLRNKEFTLVIKYFNKESNDITCWYTYHRELDEVRLATFVGKSLAKRIFNNHRKHLQEKKIKAFNEKKSIKYDFDITEEKLRKDGADIWDQFLFKELGEMYLTTPTNTIARNVMFTVLDKMDTLKKKQ